MHANLAFLGLLMLSPDGICELRQNPTVANLSL